MVFWIAALVGASTAAAQTILDAHQFTVTCGTSPTEIGGRLKDRERRVTVQVPEETPGPVTIWLQGTGNASGGLIVEPGQVWSSGGKLGSRLKLMCRADSAAEVRATETL